MAIAKLLRIRLFLEGIEVPVVAAQVQSNLNSPAVASIQVVPLDEVMELKPRTMVHLFYLDTDLKNTNKESTGENKTPPPDQPELSGYRLLFSGEIVGFSYVQTPQSRAVVLQCLDFSSYWDACHATAIDWGPNGNAFYNDSALYGSNNVLFDNIVSHQPEKLVQWLNDTPKTPGLTSVGGLAGGIISMLEAMGGVPGHERGVNDFFSVAELRCKILEQITAEENDSSAARLLQKSVFDEWLKNGLQNIGLQVTFRDMMKLLFQYIYYDMVPNPAAKYSPFKKGELKLGATEPFVLKSNPKIAVSVEKIRLIRRKLIDKTRSTDSTSTKAEVTTYIKELKKEEEALRLIKASDALKASRLVFSAYTALAGKVDKEEPGDYGIEVAVKNLDSVIEVIEKSKNKTFVVGADTTSSTNDRLHSIILRPDCFFVPPPRCNVIFPEDYVQLSYDRVFTSEVTRAQLLLYNSLVSEGDRMFATAVVSPFLSKTANETIKGAGSSSYRSLMKHELHTGIIPRSEWLSNTVAFDGKVDKAQLDKKRSGRLNWMKRASLFHFFKWRYASRQASVSGRFNPKVVCGFPGLIITKPFYLPEAVSGAPDLLEKVQNNASELNGPVHLIGMINSVSHSISQDGGTTSLAMHHVRQHRGSDDELISVLTKNKKTKKVVVRIPLASNTEDDTVLKFLADLTPQSAPVGKGKVLKGKQTVKTGKVTAFEMKNGIRVEKESTFSIPQRAEESSTGTANGLVVSGSIPDVEGTFMVPALPTKKHRGTKGFHGGTVLGVSVEDSSVSTTKFGKAFKSVVLYEELEVPVTTETPIEENIRPDWFSNNYSNLMIGANIYEPFFGCGSIVDDLVATGFRDPKVTIPFGTFPDTQITAPPSKTLTEINAEVSSAESLKASVSIEKAANMIGYLYGVVKSDGRDVDRFIANFTDRPIATLEEVLGDMVDLTLVGDKVASVTGTLGFHTLAVHQKTVEAGNLTGLLRDPQLSVPRIRSKSNSKPIPPGYDVRLEKREAVLKYYDALKRGPAFIG